MILFGLSGGLGNCIFALPAIKALSRTRDVSILVDGDYAGMRDLFARNRYAPVVDKVPPGAQLLCGQYAPAAFSGLGFERCGWPYGTSHYRWSEAEQIMRQAVGRKELEAVDDWIDVPKEKEIDFALIPGCKPGNEWSRKKWDGFYQLALALEAQRFSVEAFGQREEIEEAKLRGWWVGNRVLEALPEQLSRCRVCVGTDSGIAHLASSLGIPTAMLFTATSPIKGRPLGPHKTLTLGLQCAPCQSTERWRECRDWRCRAIKVDDVIREAVKMLDRPIEDNVP